ncbi:hypothetical protein cypCar_00041116 [Cyprinus carpio]|nr:hypothetical protein cypCar_00041116 [Cyprinus carpio]
MGEYEDILHRLEGEARHFPPPPRHPGGRERLNIQKSSVCSRAYFVVVMAFFHLYIINIIALLLYVHYNTGSGEQDVPLEKSAGAPRPMPAEPQTPSSATLSPELSFRLPRLEGIRVGHVQRVSLVPDRTHNMRTLSLKPLLFEIPGFLSVEESSVVMQLAQLKGLTHSSLLTAPDSQEEQLTQDELFSLLDLNQDGLLQREEVRHSHAADADTYMYQFRVLSLQEFKRVSGGVLQYGSAGQGLDGHAEVRQRSTHTRLYLGQGTHHLLKSIRNRYLTVLLHLNSADGGGETSFPVADNRTYEEEVLGDLSQQYCDKGNLKVKPVAGTALLWYNHLSDGNGWVGELDEFSLHGDCLVTRGFKWTGSVWVNIDPDQQRQERYQRLVSWHPDGQSKKPEHGDLHQDL